MLNDSGAAGASDVSTAAAAGQARPARGQGPWQRTATSPALPPPITPNHVGGKEETMAIPIPRDVRQLLSAPKPCAPVDLADRWLTAELGGVGGARGRPHPRVHLDPRVALSVADMANPCRMAAIQGRVVEARPDAGCRYMDPISFKYTGAPFPSRGPDRVCFVICGGEGGRADTQLCPPSGLTHRRSGPCTVGHRRASERPGARRV